MPLNNELGQPAWIAEAGFGYGFATGQNPAWSIAQVLEACGASLLGEVKGSYFRAVCTDSRAIEPGDLFVALSGDRFDGHQFIDQAVRRGAAGVIVSRDLEKPPPCPVIQVRDTLKALGDLAAYRRHLMPNLKVAAITGSCGKTTVKDMVADILASRYQIIKTKGNFNNLIGLPLSLLPVSFHHRFAVLEMGMNSPGEIRRLTAIADPDVACITMITEAHLEGLVSVKGVARAKAELFEGMRRDKKLVVNLDDRRIRKIASGLNHRQITFGLRPGAEVRATHVKTRGKEGQDYTLHVGAEKRRIKSRLLGRHNIGNSLAAAAVCVALGISINRIAAGLACFNPPEKRLRTVMLPSGIVLLDDAYNANPGSVRAALETVKAARGKAKSVAALGDMLELGERAGPLHEKIGTKVHDCGFDWLLTYGDFAGMTASGAINAGMAADRVITFGSKKDMVGRLREMILNGMLASGDWILIKGSRGMRMEEVAEGLLAGRDVGCPEKKVPLRCTGKT